MDYLPFALFAFTVYIAYKVVAPFATALVLALILAYIFRPLQDRLNSKVKNASVSAFIITVTILIIIGLSLTFFINSVVKETNSLYSLTRDKLASNDFLELECQGQESILCDSTSRLNSILSIGIVSKYIHELTASVTQSISDWATRTIVKIPRTFVQVLMLFFMLFYFVRDNALLSKKLHELLPLRAKEKNEIYRDVKNVIYGVLYGSIIVAILQGIMGALGFYFFGIPSPIFWGMIMALLALIPLIGAMVVWGPAAAYVVASGLVTNDTGLVAKGVFLALYGMLLISSVENILKPKIIGDHAKIHPVIILMGVFGGLKAFGIMGFFVGPLALALIVTFIGIIKRNSVPLRAMRKRR